MWYYDDSLPETLDRNELKQFCEKKHKKTWEELEYDYDKETSRRLC